MTEDQMKYGTTLSDPELHLIEQNPLTPTTLIWQEKRAWTSERKVTLHSCMAGKQSPAPVAAAQPQPSPSLLLQSCVTVQTHAGVVDFGDRTVVSVHKGDVDVD
jgi:hypothetical protein